MIYRETGNFVTNYFKDREIFPLKFDKIIVIIGLLFLLLIFWYGCTPQWAFCAVKPSKGS